MTNSPEDQRSTEIGKRDTDNNIPPVVRQPSSAIPEAAPTEPQRHKPRKRCQWTKDKGMFWVTFAGLVALIIYTAYTRLLVIDAEDTAKRQLRAYVLFDKGIVSISGKSGSITVEIKNTGQTPAYNITSWWDLKLVDLSETDNDDLFRFRETTDASIDIGPSGIIPLRKQILPADVIAVNSRNKALVAWGAIKYRDSFGRCQFTTFRVIPDLRDNTNEFRLIGAANGNAASDPASETCEPKDGPYAKSTYPAENEKARRYERQKPQPR